MKVSPACLHKVHMHRCTSTAVHSYVCAGIAQSVQRLARGRTAQGSRMRFSAPVQTGPGGPLSLVCNGYRAPLPGIKRPGRGVDQPPPSSADIGERTELYFYPSGPSWPVLRRNFTFTFLHKFYWLISDKLRVYH